MPEGKELSALEDDIEDEDESTDGSSAGGLPTATDSIDFDIDMGGESGGQLPGGYTVPPQVRATVSSTVHVLTWERSGAVL